MASNPEISDAVIAKQALDNREAFGILIERYQDKLDRYLKRLGVGNSEDRTDLLQDVFIAAYRHLNGYDQGLSFSSWIYRIAHNTAMSFHRKRTGHPYGVPVDDADMALVRIADEGMDTAGDAEQRINSEHLGKALSALPEKYRDVLILRFYEDKEYQEISDILEIPLGSASTLLFRAKQALKKELSYIAV